MQVTLSGDSLGRVVGRIAHNGAEATVSGSDATALEDLKTAVESAIAGSQGECFWHEAMIDYRWLFRRERDVMRVVIIRSSGTLTGWEHCFWAEVGASEFEAAMREAVEGFAVCEAPF